MFCTRNYIFFLGLIYQKLCPFFLAQNQKLRTFFLIWHHGDVCLNILFVVIFPHFEQWFFSGLWKCWNFVFRSLILSMSSRSLLGLCVLSNVTRYVLVVEKEYLYYILYWQISKCVSWFLWMTLTERKRCVCVLRLCNHLDGIVVVWDDERIPKLQQK